MNDRVFLNVPSRHRSKARGLGAKWESSSHGWWIDISQLERFNRFWPDVVPRRYRSIYDPPYTTSDMIPQNTWYVNLRKVLDPQDWARVSASVCESAGDRCSICGGRGEQLPVECDEVWAFAESESADAGTQILHGLIALCPGCYSMRHLGQAHVEGQLASALQHMALINEWTDIECRQYVGQAFEQWWRRSTMTWQFDVTAIQTVLSPFNLHPSNVNLQAFFAQYEPFDEPIRIRQQPISGISTPVAVAPIEQATDSVMIEQNEPLWRLSVLIALVVVGLLALVPIAIFWLWPDIHIANFISTEFTSLEDLSNYISDEISVGLETWESWIDYLLLGIIGFLVLIIAIRQAPTPA